MVREAKAGEAEPSVGHGAGTGLQTDAALKGSRPFFWSLRYLCDILPLPSASERGEAASQEIRGEPPGRRRH